MKQIKSASKKQKRAAYLSLLLLFAVIVLLNILGSFKFYRFDLTSEKRYTLNPASISLLQNMKDVVYLKIYLEGELPASYKKLRNSTQEMLDEFRAYTPLIEYEFIDPSASSDEKERKAIYRQLMNDGLTYTTPVEESGSAVSQTLIWPGALLTYRGKTIPLQLLKSQTYANQEEMINRSINDLEYELTNAIRKLGTVNKPSVAFIEGHGELDSLETKDITLGLEEYYTVERVRLDSNLTSLVYRGERGDTVTFRPRFKAIIIAKPDSAFSEKDKFIIDQYIMRGGKVLWLIDRVEASMDSLGKAPTFMVYPLELNLDDQLFRYGARVNANLLMDLRSASIPLVTGRIGNQPKLTFFKWFYFPLSMPASNHPIVNNLNAIRFEFANSIDTISAAGIKKTILLSSSKRAQLINAPARISLNILKEQPEPRLYPLSNVPIAVLLEGEFSSNFKNRLRPEIRNNSKIGFVEKSVRSTAMIIISDGDLIKNGVSRTTGKLTPLGFDKYTRELFGNKDFIMNSVNYLCDDGGLISVRSREVKLRMLDDAKIKTERATIQLKNVAYPIGIAVFLGLVINFIRRRKFAGNPN
jgi:ABC-2 type transport system permease protein